MPGGISMNLHEGFRSEYLAQYVFASFGTAVSVPSQEDLGLDLYCTLVERKGALAWPKAYFSVQVKSKNDVVSWKFKTKEEVHWLIEYPLPLFLCVVDKNSARIEVYHTLPRFEIWTLPPFPPSLELLPGPGMYGDFTPWDGTGKLFLGKSILDFSVQQMLADSFYDRTRQVLLEWIKFDQENLNRISNGLHSMYRPAQYETNSPNITDKGICWLGLGHASEEHLQLVLQRLKEQLSWIVPHLKGSDFGGASRAALLHHYLFKGSPDHIFDIESFFLDEMNSRFNSKKYLYDGLDKLDEKLTEALEELSAPPQ